MKEYLDDYAWLPINVMDVKETPNYSIVQYPNNDYYFVPRFQSKWVFLNIFLPVTHRKAMKITQEEANKWKIEVHDKRKNYSVVYDIAMILFFSLFYILDFSGVLDDIFESGVVVVYSWIFTGILGLIGWPVYLRQQKKKIRKNNELVRNYHPTHELIIDSKMNLSCWMTIIVYLFIQFLPGGNLFIGPCFFSMFYGRVGKISQIYTVDHVNQTIIDVWMHNPSTETIRINNKDDPSGSLIPKEL